MRAVIDSMTGGLPYIGCRADPKDTRHQKKKGRTGIRADPKSMPEGSSRAEGRTSRGLWSAVTASKVQRLGEHTSP